MFSSLGILKWSGGCALGLMALFACLLITLWVLVIQFLPPWAQPIAMRWVLGERQDETVTRTRIQGNNAPFGWPVIRGPISAGFNDLDYLAQFGQMHDGIDIVVPAGTPIYATMDGCVVVAGWNDSGYGYLVVLDNAPFLAYYAHMQAEPAVRVGQCVSRGALLGYVGATGNTTGAHLHYGVWYYGEGWLNPADFLAEDGPPTQVVAPRTGKTLMLGLPPGFDLEALLNGPRQTQTSNGADPNIPLINGTITNGGFGIISARQLSPDESHYNAARVQGFVFDAGYNPRVGVAVRVCWSGGCMNGVTNSSGYYEFILSPGVFTVYVNQGDQPWGQSATFRTDLPEAYGHYTYVINFMASR
ncbi:MAG: M23 family metallopeptidase [Chloroflexota bacterium]